MIAVTIGRTVDPLKEAGLVSRYDRSLEQSYREPFYWEGLTMQAAIGYFRVSTREQGRSGLGLAAQRHEIEQFGARERFSVKSWHQDVQTGDGADALLLRPGLAAALKEAKSARCPLIVSRLDRLSRNVHFEVLLRPQSTTMLAKPTTIRQNVPGSGTVDTLNSGAAVN